MSSTGAWSSSLPLTPRSGADGWSSSPNSLSESLGAALRKSSIVFVPIACPRASGRLAVGHGVLARARHVHRQGGDPGTMEEARGALAILLPAVDPAPMHDHRRLADPRGNLQIADERLALERNLYDRKRWLVMLRR